MILFLVIFPTEEKVLRRRGVCDNYIDHFSWCRKKESGEKAQAVILFPLSFSAIRIGTM